LFCHYSWLLFLLQSVALLSMILFEYISLIVTTSTSCKRRDKLIENQCQNTLRRIETGEVSTGRGLNQETVLARPRDTRWG